MAKATSHSGSTSSTIVRFKRDLAIAQVNALAQLLAANNKADPHEGLMALMLRLQRDSEALDASDRKVLRAVDRRVALALKKHPDPALRDYGKLLWHNLAKAPADGRKRARSITTRSLG